MPTDWNSLWEQAGPIAESEPQTPYDFATARVPGRVYVSKSAPLMHAPGSRDYGHPFRVVRQVHDVQGDTPVSDDDRWERVMVYQSPAGRVQVEAMVAREDGAVREIKFQRATQGQLTSLFTLDRSQSESFLAYMRALEHVPVVGDASERIDDSLLQQVFHDPRTVAELYERDPVAFRSKIESDTDAEDLAALAHRREVVSTFRTWLEDDDAFAIAHAEAGGPEHAWQGLFENEPWLLGIGLGGQLFTAWDPDRLEQVVRGNAVDGSGKRVDALMRTSGSIRSIVLAEIKHHQTNLLAGTPYRADCWAPSGELAGAVVQAQQTAHTASKFLGELLERYADDGSLLGEAAYLVRPRNYLVVGRLDSLRGEQGGVHPAKFRSFELYRRNLNEPDVITFDELLARAEWLVERLEATSTGTAVPDDHDGEPIF